MGARGLRDGLLVPTGPPGGGEGQGGGWAAGGWSGAWSGPRRGGLAGRAAQMGPPQEFWPTETQPVTTDAVTVRWVADGSAAGWPCTFLHVTHVSWAAGWGGALRRAARTAPPRLGSGANVSTQKASGKERPVQRLQFPCWEPGQALPTETLLPFLAAVGRCCSRDTEQPGTLLSHCRCRWTGPRGAGGARTASRLRARARGHSPPRSVPTPPGNPCPSAWAQAGGGSPGRPSPVPWPRPPVAPPT